MCQSIPEAHACGGRHSPYRALPPKVPPIPILSDQGHEDAAPSCKVCTSDKFSYSCEEMCAKSRGDDESPDTAPAEWWTTITTTPESLSQTIREMESISMEEDKDREEEQDPQQTTDRIQTTSKEHPTTESTYTPVHARSNTCRTAVKTHVSPQSPQTPQPTPSRSCPHDEAESDKREYHIPPGCPLPILPAEYVPLTCPYNSDDGRRCHLQDANAEHQLFTNIKSWRRHVNSHADDTSSSSRSSCHRWLHQPDGDSLVPCCALRRQSYNGRLKDKQEILLRLACEPGEPCRPDSDPATSTSVNQQLRARRARKRQREKEVSQERARQLLKLPQSDKPPPTTEEILSAQFSPGKVFAKIPRSCLHKARQVHLAALQAFCHATPGTTQTLPRTTPPNPQNNTLHSYSLIYSPMPSSAASTRAKTALAKCRRRRQHSIPGWKRSSLTPRTHSTSGGRRKKHQTLPIVRLHVTSATTRTMKKVS